MNDALNNKKKFFASYPNLVEIISHMRLKGIFICSSLNKHICVRQFLGKASAIKILNFYYYFNQSENSSIISSKTYFFYRDTIVSRMRSKGVLTGGCGESAIRLRPALIFEPKHAEIMLEKFEEVLTEMEQKH